jgi:hypothetical protein
MRALQGTPWLDWHGCEVADAMFEALYGLNIAQLSYTATCTVRVGILHVLESLWKQNLYKTMLWFVCLAKLRTDLLDNRSLAILLETYKLLIC